MNSRDSDMSFKPTALTESEDSSQQIGALPPRRNTIVTDPPMDGSWRTLNTRTIADCSPWLTLFQQSIALPNGVVIDDYYRLVLPDHVVIYPRTSDGMVATLHQYKHGLGAKTLTLPGGLIEIGEKPAQAAERELREETGLESACWYHLGTFRVNGNLGCGDGHYFLADHCRFSGPITSDDLEDTTMQWYHPDQLVCLLQNGQLPLMHHALAVSLVHSFEHNP